MTEPQIIAKDGKPEYVVIPVSQWRRIEAKLEELDDIRALDRAMAKPSRRMIPFEVTSAILDGTHPIRAWREHRGLDRAALARSADLSPTDLQRLEDGTLQPTRAALRALGRALDADVDDLRAST